jgi:hypothetical protein
MSPETREEESETKARKEESGMREMRDLRQRTTYRRQQDGREQTGRKQTGRKQTRRQDVRPRTGRQGRRRDGQPQTGQQHRRKGAHLDDRGRRQQSGRVRNGLLDTGAVTAETAIVLPVLIVLLLVGLWAVGVVVANIRCVDAARDVARAVARGEPGDVAKRIGERSAPAGAAVGISREGADVRVVVAAEVNLDWVLLSKLPSVEVRGQAAVQIEPGTWEGLP